MNVRNGTQPLELCANCGHEKSRHGYAGTAFRGTLAMARCFATIDKRPLAAGGDTLTACSCAGWRAEGEPIRA